MMFHLIDRCSIGNGMCYFIIFVVISCNLKLYDENVAVLMKLRRITIKSYNNNRKHFGITEYKQKKSKICSRPNYIRPSTPITCETAKSSNDGFNLFLAVHSKGFNSDGVSVYRLHQICNCANTTLIGHSP